MFLADHITRFYLQLQPPVNLPAGIGVLFPQQQEDVQAIVHRFFNKFYKDRKLRYLIFGINPGRFGAGITGINFTAPKQLNDYCGIHHPFKQSSELSAEFIYEMIGAYGGAKKFYKDFFLSALSPLGFVKDGKNINYYDDKNLLKAITPFIIQSVEQQLSFGFKRDCCFCIGEDKNYKFLLSLNDTYKWFEKIVPLPHPRFIMQYRRREKEIFIERYISQLTGAAAL